TCRCQTFWWGRAYTPSPVCRRSCRPVGHRLRCRRRPSDTMPPHPSSRTEISKFHSIANIEKKARPFGMWRAGLCPGARGRARCQG
ncbi:Protein of unknown function, partial [Gryllus bimaculatus]